MNIIQGIVADSPARFRRSGEFAALRARLRAEARLRHGGALKGATFWRRLWLEDVIRREVRAELARLHPPGALYVSQGAR